MGIEVYPVGSKVYLGNFPEDTFEATITAVSIRAGNAVTYEVSWFDGKTFREQWMPPMMFRAKPDRMETIGFRQPEK